MRSSVIFGEDSDLALAQSFAGIKASPTAKGC